MGGSDVERADSGHYSPERSSLSLRVRSLSDGTHPVDLVRDAEVLDYPLFYGPVKVVGTLEKEGDRIHVQGTASAQGHFECTRCTEPFDRWVKAALAIEFVPPRLESDPEDENVHVYDPLARPFIDITEDVRDALALAIPMKHLCRTDCKGLCPTCGTDLNKGQCNCNIPVEIEGNWSALKGLGDRLRAEESKGLGHFPQNN